MVSKFKSLSALEEILARGAILGDNPNFGDNFSLRGGSVRGTTRLPALLTCRPGTHFSHMTLLDYLFIYVLHAFVLLLIIFGIH